MVFQYVIERNHTPALAALILPEHVVAEIVGRDHIAERPFLGHILNPEAGYVETVVGGHFGGILHVEGTHAGLSVAQGKFHF